MMLELYIDVKAAASVQSVDIFYEILGKVFDNKTIFFIRMSRHHLVCLQQQNQALKALTLYFPKPSHNMKHLI